MNRKRSPLGASEHEARIRNHFGGRLVSEWPPMFRETPGGRGAIFILFSHRTGSNYFAELLASTGYCNKAREILNAKSVITGSQKHGDATFGDYLQRLCSQSARGRFALKAQFAQYEFLAREGILDALFPERQILITERLDKIAQAISWSIASQTKEWTTQHKSLLPRDRVRYDGKAIKRKIRALRTAHCAIESYLNVRGEQFRRVIYEDLVNATELTVGTVGMFIGCPNLQIDPSKIHLERQTDRMKEEFKVRYIRELNGICDVWPAQVHPGQHIHSLIKSRN